MERSLQILGERWTFLVIREIFGGKNRFAEIRDALGVAPNLLSARLKRLVEGGVLRTRTYQEPGSRHRQSYHLTQAGQDVRLILVALEQWGDTHMPSPAGPSGSFRTRSTEEPVRVGYVTDAGREVPDTDVEATFGSSDAKDAVIPAP